MKLHGRNIIGGAQSVEGSETFQAVNPATGETLPGGFHSATEAEVARAARAASEATEMLAGLAKEARGGLLRRMAAEILSLGDELIERCNAETGLPAGRLESERGRTVNQLRMFADLVDEGSWVDARIDTAVPGRTPIPKPDIRRLLVPIGPVAVFCASNFPLAFSVAGGDTASAIAAGNAVIVKAHSSHPGTAELVGTALSRAVEAEGLAPGLFSLLHGPGRTIGISLVTHSEVKAAGFTGSKAGGRALFDAAASRLDPIPVYAELGSTNPVFVLPGALRARGAEIAEGLKNSTTLGVGQFCTNPGLVFGVGSAELDSFVDAAGRLFAATQPATMLNQRIRSAYEEGVGRLRETDGVSVAGESEPAADTTGNEGAAVIFRTDCGTFQQNLILREEVFGPATVVVQGESADELMRIVEGMEGHLAATIHGTEEDLLEHSSLIALLRRKAGRLIFNGFPTGVEVCPSMTHGGPYPATTDVHFTSVGTAAIYRFARPVSYQGFPDAAQPAELQNANPLGIWRTVNGSLTREAV